MNALASIRAAVSAAFDAFEEDAQHVSQDGVTRLIKVIRMENMARLSPIGQAFEDQGPFVYVREFEVTPERDDQITLPDGAISQVVAVDNHRLRGYLRVTLSNLE